MALDRMNFILALISSISIVLNWIFLAQGFRNLGETEV